MKLILSRKGFDSGVTNCASPILPDGSMLSLPIPLGPAAVTYRDIAWRGRPLGPIVEALSRGMVRQDDAAHLDPDLYAAARPRLPGWRPAFGQHSGAQTHLERQGIKEGDLFLFFGWFERTNADATRFLPGTSAEHVLFGWLQIGEILTVRSNLDRHRLQYPWLADHPHLYAHDKPGSGFKPNSTVYLAADRLVLDGRDMGVGGGLFARYHPVLRLTAAGSSTRRHWHVPGWLRPAETQLTYHLDRSKWGEHGGRVSLTSASQGQEFVATVRPPDLADWMAILLAGGRDDAAP